MQRLLLLHQMSSARFSDVATHPSSFVISVNSPCKDFIEAMLDNPAANSLENLQELKLETDDISFVDYQRLADILNQAPNLRALTVLKLDNHLSRRGSCLADTIANLQDLRALDLQDIDEGGFKLCRRLACRPDLVCLKGLIKIWMEGLEGTMVHFAVDRTALLGLPVFQHASVVALDGFSLLHGDGGTVDPWPNVRTLSLTNMDPLAVAAMCPNLTCLQLGYFCPEDDHFESFIHDREYPYSTDALGCTLGIRLRLLDIFVDSEESMPPRVIPVTIRATLPVVLSVRFPADATALWEELACTLRDTASRTRYLDVLFLRGDQPIIYSMRKKNGSLVHPGPPRTSPQEWLVCSPLIADLLALADCRLAGEAPSAPSGMRPAVPPPPPLWVHDVPEDHPCAV